MLFFFQVPATAIITGTANIRETKDAYAAMLSMARVCSKNVAVMTAQTSPTLRTFLLYIMHAPPTSGLANTAQ